MGFIKKYIEETKNAIISLIIEILMTALLSYLFPNTFTQVNTFALVIILVFFAIFLGLILSNIKKHNKYSFHFKYSIDKLYYDGDAVELKQDYYVYPIRLKKTNQMHTEKEWYSDECATFKTLTAGFGVKEKRKVGNKREYYITFPKYYHFFEKLRFQTIFQLDNRNRKFKNFYCKKITAPTDSVIIKIEIPRKYIKEGGKAILKEYLKYDEGAGSIKKAVDFDGYYEWKIDSPKTEWTYEIEWEWIEDPVYTNKNN